MQFRTRLSSEYPKTVADAVEWLKSVMEPADLDRIAGMAEEELSSLHFGLGLFIRNSLQVWHNSELKADAGVEHDDDVSAVIIQALWRRLKDETERKD